MIEMEKDKIAICFNISKETDQRFREFLAQKYHGYHRGVLSEAFESALIQFMNTQRNDE
jgi:hypothetical protein